MFYKNFFWILCNDIWPWFILFFYIMFDINLSKYSINFNLKKFFNLQLYLENIHFNFKNYEKVIRTEFFIISSYTSICLTLFYIIYSLFPFITVLLSHIIFFILFYYMIKPLENDFLNNNNLDFNFITKSKYFFIIFIIFIIYTIIEISRVLNSKNSIEETSDSLIGGKEKRTNSIFYLLLLFFIIFINFETILIRIYTENYTNKIHKPLFYLFLLHEIFFNSYLFQSLFSLLFCSKIIKNFRKFNFFEIFNIILISRVAAVFKLFNVFLAILGFLARLFNLNEKKLGKLYYYLDTNRLKVLYAIVYCKPYFKSSQESRKFLWKGELKKKIMKIESKNSLLPMVFISFFIFKTYFGFILQFYRYVDIFALLLNYFLMFYEAFVSYDMVKEFSPYYLNNMLN